jgi:hypothetical protein
MKFEQDEEVLVFDNRTSTTMVGKFIDTSGDHSELCVVMIGDKVESVERNNIFKNDVAGKILLVEALGNTAIMLLHKQQRLIDGIKNDRQRSKMQQSAP